MSRKELPKTFPGQQLLFEDIKTKVDDDGIHGELVAFLADHGIDLTADKVLVDAAALKYTSFLTYNKQSENLCAQRDKLLNPVIKSVTKAVQFLKGYYNPEYKSLGDWNVVVTNGGKVTIATDPALFLTFIIAFKAKNDSYTGTNTSPLAQYLTKKGLNLALCVTNTTDAVAINDTFKTATTNSEDAHQVMETKSSLPFANLLLITNFLMKLYEGNEKALGVYGIKVITAPRVEKIKNLKLAIGEDKLKQEVKIGSIIVNMGEEPINIHKGKTVITTNPIVLGPGEKFVTTKGYSKVSYQNPSTTKFAKIQVIPRDKSKS